MDAAAPARAQAGPEAGAFLTVDLGALAANWRKLATRAAPAECAGVVKADAYGLGLEPVARALWNAGCRTFFVAHLIEGRGLRGALPDAVVYVLNGLLPGTAAAFAEADLRPVLGSLPEIDEWAAFCRAAGPRPAAIHVDTGMNRLGLRLAEAEARLATPNGLDGFRPSLLMSHLACADEPGHPLTARQLDAFRRIRSLLPGVPASLANSAGTLSGPEFAFDLVRPGIALYGCEAVDGRPNPMAPVVRLEARIIQLREAGPGETVGYGARFTLRRPSRIAILSIGYADGYLRAAGSSDERPGAEAAIGGRRVPLLGRVSMDLLAVDVTDLPAELPRRGAPVELMGPTIRVDEVARAAGTIGYEVLTRLGNRFSRNYMG